MRIDRLRQNYGIDVVFRHFPLHPDTSEDGLTLEELFAGRNLDIPAMKLRMSRLMAEEGLPYGDRTMTFNSRLAQELAAWADSRQPQSAIHDALFRAYFVAGRNIGRKDVLLEVAEQVGLRSAEAAEVLESRATSDLVDADWQRSRSLGITGVPTFVAAGRSAVGAQPYEGLEQLVVAAGAKPRGGGT